LLTDVLQKEDFQSIHTRDSATYSSLVSTDSCF